MQSVNRSSSNPNQPKPSVSLSKFAWVAQRKTVFDLAKNKSVTVVDGGTLVNVSHRIRTGKTAKDRAKKGE